MSGRREDEDGIASGRYVDVPSEHYGGTYPYGTQEEKPVLLTSQVVGEGQSIASPGIMSGYFTVTELTRVKAGERIPLRIGYYARNEGAITWDSCLMAKMGAMIVILDVTDGLGPEHKVEHTYYPFVMPVAPEPIEFRLYGHDQAGHDWDISEW